MFPLGDAHPSHHTPGSSEASAQLMDTPRAGSWQGKSPLLPSPCSLSHGKSKPLPKRIRRSTDSTKKRKPSFRFDGI